jgi:hypothetical protein
MGDGTWNQGCTERPLRYLVRERDGKLWRCTHFRLTAKGIAVEVGTAPCGRAELVPGWQPEYATNIAGEFILDRRWVKFPSVTAAELAAVAYE